MLELPPEQTLPEKKKASLADEVSALMKSEGISEMDALKRVARQRGIGKSEAYRELQRDTAACAETHRITLILFPALQHDRSVDVAGRSQRLVVQDRSRQQPRFSSSVNSWIARRWSAVAGISNLLVLRNFW